jgi:glycosyltransferase involved in cell wall biosynthesis
MRIALLGTRGIPARYGGFETALEEIAPRLARAGHEVTVYCRGERSPATYKGVRRVVLPALRRRSLETLSHTLLSCLHAAKHRPDVAIVFNCANAPLLPILKAAHIPTAVHVDGLEWRRGKWGPVGRRYYRTAERVAVRLADALIADARAIGDHIGGAYGRGSEFIPYGMNRVQADPERIAGLGLTSRQYHLVVARLEPENHVDLILRGYQKSSARKPLVLVGDNPYDTSYAREVRRMADDPKILPLGSVWDQGLLDQLYANALSYLHGHSVGGTNPSLLRAIGAGAPVTAFDVVFNREVAAGEAAFFLSADDVAEAIESDERDPSAAIARGEKVRREALGRYSWDDVAHRYALLCDSLGTRSRD